MKTIRVRSPMVKPLGSGASSLGNSGACAYIAVENPFAGQRARYTLWRLPLNGETPPAERLGAELPIADCRRIAKQRGAR